VHTQLFDYKISMYRNDHTAEEAVIPAVAWSGSFIYSSLLAVSVTSPLLGHSVETYDTLTGQRASRMAHLHSQCTSLQWNLTTSTQLAVGYHGSGFECYDLRQDTSSKIYETTGCPSLTKMEWSADGLTLAFGSTQTLSSSSDLPPSYV
jgi:hypothetical protein